MGSILIILHSPGFNFLFRIVQGQEPVRIQTFIPKAAIERFDNRVFRALRSPGSPGSHRPIWNQWGQTRLIFPPFLRKQESNELNQSSLTLTYPHEFDEKSASNQLVTKYL